MNYTLDNIQTAPSYDALKRNGFSDLDVVAYYGTPIEDRGEMFIQIKARNNAKKFNAPTYENKGTQMCTGTLFSQVDAEFRRLMNTTFEFKGVSYNLVKLGYSFGWNNNKSRFGVHKMKFRRNFLGDREYFGKRIELSKYCLDYSEKTIEDWQDTILHEIAHGIDAAIRGRSNHDWRWVSVAKHIGCSGERCGDYEMKKERPSKYTIKCPTCGNERKGHKHSIKVARGRKSCGKCSGGSFNPKHALIQIQNY